jgi:glycosyltransferase involved in cell wall biosynthesis
MIPTCIDPSLYPERGHARGAGFDANHVDLVWIGSGSTLRGLQQQQGLWDRLGAEIPGLRLRVICDQFPSLKRLPVVPVPWSQEWEARDLALGQIGVSWLPDDPWSRGKCGLKILQYQAARLPVVANPVGTQSELIEHGVTGLLAATPDEWVQNIRLLAADAGLRRRMGEVARRRVESEFSVDAWAETFVNTVIGMEEWVAPAQRSSKPRRGSIPHPFFVRLRRTDTRRHLIHASHFDGTRAVD